MKKLVFFLAAISFSIYVHSQNKARVIISAEISYNETSRDNGGTRDLNTMEGHYLEGGLSAGFFLSNGLIAGVGLDINNSSEDRYSQIIINRYMQIEEMVIKSNMVLPSIFAGYYFQIAKDLYCNVNLKLCYGEFKTNYRTFIAGRMQHDTGFYPIDPYNEYNISIEETSSQDYFSVGIHPQLTYFITKHFGLFISPGSIEYSLLDWSNDNSAWNANFNPSYWRFGVKIEF